FPCVQSRLTHDELADLLYDAWCGGIRFWDTAARYGTYSHVGHALKRVPREQVVVTAKFHEPDAAAARREVERALRELDTPYLDVMLLHEVDSAEEWEERQPALQVLYEARDAGRIRAIGLSTHCIDLLEMVVGDPRLQVIFTNVNHAGIHMDADLRHYLAALQKAYDAGQGVYVHKTLGEGALGATAAAAIQHNLSLPCVHSVCVGLTSREELQVVLQAARQAQPNYPT
ncbi:MAG: aldo/keto reductase, partial [Candidatus Xenobia bacterium]